MRIPEGFDEDASAILADCRAVAGHLKEREVFLLVLAAATADAAGEILEIGSYKGKSTVVLARAARISGRAGVVAVDPLTPDAVEFTAVSSGADPAMVRDEFYANLERSGVRDQVEFHEMTSGRLAESWNRPIRLLWIDGDHSYASAKSDFSKFAPYLTDGAIVAMHDVLNPFDGPVAVFAEDILPSDEFGPCGFCGSIGWTRRLRSGESIEHYVRTKRQLLRKIRRLLPFVAGGHQQRGLRRTLFKLCRSRIPHDALDTAAWLQAAGGADSPAVVTDKHHDS